MKTKTAIYIRVSTDKQESSVELQREKCEAYCRMMGYKVEALCIDADVSGGTELFERPEGSKLKELIESKAITHIVSWKLDRLFRSTIDGLMSIKFLNNNNINFSLIDMGGSTIDTSTPMGKFITSTFLAIGELERDTTKDRVKKAINHKKQNLKVYSGKVPFGFIREGDTLIIDKKEMETVKEMYDMKEKGVSYREISWSTNLGLSRTHRILNDEFYEKFI